MAKCACPVETTTTNIDFYAQHEKPTYRGIVPGRDTLDQELISFHNENTLQVNGLRIKSKIWPHMLEESEEYKDFLERLKHMRGDVYELYFKHPPVDHSVPEDRLKDLNKTAYQRSYSPNEFLPLREARRFAIEDNRNFKIKYHETTTNNYYSRMSELERYRSALYGKILDQNRSELKKELRNIKGCGSTTYHETISRPGAVHHKKTLPNPIDRHTNRRIYKIKEK